MAADPRTVLVTGGSGYLAGWIIVALLRDGHVVKTTIRDLAREAQVRATIERHVPVGRLSFHAANLLDDTGWEAAVEGAGRVLHVASPMPVREYKGQDLVTPAREGARRVITAARRAGVPRLVMTSSVAAAIPSERGDGATDEAVWTDPAGKGVSEYTRSKTLAERGAWELAETPGSDMTLTTILPGFIQGPALGREVSGSLEALAMMLRGRIPMLPRVSFAIVDTRDVVDLHVAALTHPDAPGHRFIVAADPLWFRQMAEVLKARLGDAAAKVRTFEAPDAVIRALALVSADMKAMAPDLGIMRRFSAARAEALLGRPLRSAVEAVAAGGESLVAQGLV